VRVKISDVCAGHGRCYGNAPELFEDDEAGYSRPRLEGSIPKNLEAAARAVAAGCPESAILLIEE
jgi:ferredoxin